MKMSELLEGKVEMCPEACCGVPVTECTCGPNCKHCDCHAKNKIDEDATAGATSAGNIASVANPIAAHAKVKRDKNGVPKAAQRKKKDGTTVNGLDAPDNVFGGKAVRRTS
jgi:hypothetical protein